MKNNLIMKDNLKKALFALTAKPGCKFPSLEGVLYQKGYVVASDSTILVAVKTEYPADREGRIFLKNGLELSEKPLNWYGIVPHSPDEFNNEKYARVTKTRDLEQACRLMPVSPDEDGKRLCIMLENVCFYPPRILAALKVFKAAGEDPETYVRIQGNSPFDYRMYLYSQTISVTIAPVYLAKDYDDQHLTIEDILSIGELL